MTDRNPRTAAIIGLVVTALLVAFTFTVGGLHLFQKTYRVAAVFDAASGVTAGDPVRLAGVDVGSVAAVERLPRDGTVRIELEVNSGVSMSRATRASIRLRTLLGSKYVSLEDPGTGPRLAKDGVIPQERTESPADLDELLGALHKVAEPIDVKALNGVINPFAKALEGRGQTLNGLLTDLSTLAGVLSHRQHDIDTLVAAAARLTAAVDDRSEDLAGTVDGFATVLATLSARRVELTRLIDEVGKLSTTLTPLLDQNQATAGQFLGDTLEVVEVLDAQRARLDLAIPQLATLGERYTRITGQGSWINVYFVGIVPGPYVANPIDLGSNDGLEPGETGGLPRLWATPPASPEPPPSDVAGTEVDTTNDDVPPPPEGYPGR